MSLTDLTPTEQTTGLVLTLLKDGKFLDARTKADELLSIGTPSTTINACVYDYFKQLCNTNLTTAEKIATHFSERPYYWHCWLPEHKIQLTLKNMKSTIDYG
jgi:hypothetical protein